MQNDPQPNSGAEAPRPRVRAAEYVRMSTEHQQYSTQNQSEVIHEYAAKRGYEIIRTYADDGKSGLSIAGRMSLRRLIDDVQSGNANFRAILVYDVSRWGRFQDTDESAYYEYVCKRAGIQVVYCAEQFENDGSPTATIIKSVKRAMAGEYSRELSSKVFKGQCKLIQLGYRQGGPAGYGLRRMLVDQAGNPKGELKRGEHKSLQTDRVVLVPGPAHEVEVVRQVYSMFVEDGKREAEIAAWLQGQNVSSETGRPWTKSMVHQILTNEKYIGNNVYNRVSFKLKKKRVRNSPDMWVRHDAAFEPVVDAEAFYIVRGIIQERHRVLSDDEMVEKLRALFARHGGLSAHLIDDAESTPCSSAYRSRFGSLLRAYGLAGYAPQRDYEFIEVNRRLRTLFPDLVSDAVQRLKGAGADVAGAGGDNAERMTINGQYSAAMVVTRCRVTAAGTPRWVIRLDREGAPDITVVVRMNPDNDRPCDYYLLPLMDVSAPSLITGRWNGAALDGYRFPDLGYFAEMAVRVRIEVAA